MTLTDYSKSKAKVSDAANLSCSHMEDELAALPLADLMEDSEAERRRSSSKTQDMRRRRSSAEVMLRNGQQHGEEYDDFLEFELEIPSVHDPHAAAQQQQQASSSHLEDSMLSLGDPFDGFEEEEEEDYDEQEGDEDYEQDEDHQHHHPQRDSSALNASATSFKSSTSKRRIHRRRLRPKPGEDMHNSMNSTGSSERSLLIRNRGGSARDMSQSVPDIGVNHSRQGNKGVRSSNTSTGSGPSLSGFLEKRRQTSLLPGSTTEDLCSEMNQVAAAKGLGASSSRISRGAPPPGLMRRNTVDNPQPTTTRKLRDYSQTSCSSGRRVPANTPRMRDSSAPSNRRRSRSPMVPTSITNPPSLVTSSSSSQQRTPRRSRSHETDDDSGAIRSGRRVPPKSKSHDGTLPTMRKPRRTQSGDNNHMHNSFVTGSRIRRIQPGTAGSLTRENSVPRNGLISSSRSISPVRKPHRSKSDGQTS
ncbi:expressed unknown protein [Seminavis robusta]|uniref:Uncharacterized protein n=1 Tax=Seminavis robusta TaxID=568900 RepID=A0A9N8HVD3_9STRA|nr:expressed unknown protein [Seminavis robusta]|eukprot:Sro2305_g322620.1 n/a (474) ;mRNA; f:4633-6054